MNEKEKRGIIILVAVLVISAVIVVVLLFNEQARNRVKRAWADIREWFWRKFHKKSNLARK